MGILNIFRRHKVGVSDITTAEPSQSAGAPSAVSGAPDWLLETPTPSVGPTLDSSAPPDGDVVPPPPTLPFSPRAVTDEGSLLQSAAEAEVEPPTAPETAQAVAEMFYFKVGEGASSWAWGPHSFSAGYHDVLSKDSNFSRALRDAAEARIGLTLLTRDEYHALSKDPEAGYREALLAVETAHQYRLITPSAHAIPPLEDPSLRALTEQYPTLLDHPLFSPTDDDEAEGDDD